MGEVGGEDTRIRTLIKSQYLFPFSLGLTALPCSLTYSTLNYFTSHITIIFKNKLLYLILNYVK